MFTDKNNNLSNNKNPVCQTIFFFEVPQTKFASLYPAYKTGRLQSIRWPIIAERTAVRQAGYEAWRGRSCYHGSGVSLQKRKKWLLHFFIVKVWCTALWSLI